MGVSICLKMAPTSGYYAIYDEESKSIKLVDEQGFEEVREKVTTGKPNIDGIDYEKCRDVMRFRPIVIKRRPLSPNKPTDLLAVYEPKNQSVVAITRAEFEKNKEKYDCGPPPTLKPRPVKEEPAEAPSLTPAFTDAAPKEPVAFNESLECLEVIRQQLHMNEEIPESSV